MSGKECGAHYCLLRAKVPGKLKRYKPRPKETNESRWNPKYSNFYSLTQNNWTSNKNAECPLICYSWLNVPTTDEMFFLMKTKWKLKGKKKNKTKGTYNGISTI